MSETLPFPPVPPELEARLTPVAEFVYATRKTSERPYDLAASARDLLRSDSDEDYALVGFDGYGINSWAVHYFIVAPGLALFLQLPWGGAYMNRDDTRQRVEAAFRFAADLQAKVEYVAAEALTPKGFRLAAAITELGESKWAYVPAGTRPEAISWQRIVDVRDDIERAVARLLNSECPY